MVARRRLSPNTAPVIDTDEDGAPIVAEEAVVAAAEESVGAIPRRPQHLPRTDDREVRETTHAAPRRTRRRKDTVHDDIFYVPVDEIPEGSSYEWKRWSVHGQEDPFYIASMREQGWEPVDPRRHPNWVPPGYNQPYIIKGGQILMERPIELTQEARAEQRQLAKRQVREAEQRVGLTPRGTGTRDHPGVAPTIVKELGRMVTAIED